MDNGIRERTVIPRVPETDAVRRRMVACLHAAALAAYDGDVPAARTLAEAAWTLARMHRAAERGRAVSP